MNKEAEVGLIVPRITQYFLAIFEYIPFAVHIPFAVPPPVTKKSKTESEPDVVKSLGRPPRYLNS